MKRIEFKDIKLGHFFRYDEQDWYKHSANAAYNPWSGETRRFHGCRRVRPLGRGGLVA